MKNQQWLLRFTGTPVLGLADVANLLGVDRKMAALLAATCLACGVTDL